MRPALLAEGLGTFLIVFFGCGAILTGADRIGVNLVFGLVVFVAVFALRRTSGAHINPAVTVAAVVIDGLPKATALRYVAAQVVGALLATGLHRLLLPSHQGYGATLPVMGNLGALVLEAIMTAILVFAAIRAGDDDLRVAVAAGAVVALCGLFAGPLTGNSLNPARSIGPALFAGGSALAALPVYIIGPSLGAIAGAWLARRAL